jgi:large subunit ribosomal protein L7/L12
MTEKAEKTPKAEQAEQAQAAEKTEEKAEKKEKKQVSKKLEGLMTEIESMTVLELSDLVKALEEKFGVSAAAPVMAAGAVSAAGGAAPAEEKDSFTVVLAKVGDNKIQVIKELRTVTTLGLKEAKELVESAPKNIKEDANKEDAEAIKKKLEAVGATIELK